MALTLLGGPAMEHLNGVCGQHDIGLLLLRTGVVNMASRAGGKWTCACWKAKQAGTNCPSGSGPNCACLTICNSYQKMNTDKQ